MTTSSNTHSQIPSFDLVSQIMKNENNSSVNYVMECLKKTTTKVQKERERKKEEEEKKKKKKKRLLFLICRPVILRDVNGVGFSFKPLDNHRSDLTVRIAISVTALDFS
jgi:hypothetical protein